MVRIREIPVGSFVEVWTSAGNCMLCQVVELLRGWKVSIQIYCQSCDDGQYKTGSIVTFPLNRLNGICCTPTPLRQFGFTDSDERGWKLVYWFGDMKILYRGNDEYGISHFRFKSVHVKSYVRISCRHFHELQNIIRFLTGGELEFEYNIASSDSNEQ